MIATTAATTRVVHTRLLIVHGKSSARRVSVATPFRGVALGVKATNDDDQSPADDRTPKPANRRENVNVEGGKYGMGTRIDDALDASSNPNTFLAGALLATVGAIILFVFGPRPPTEY